MIPNRVNQNYKIKSNMASEIKKRFKGQGSTTDRKYMNDQMQKIFEFLDSYHIYEYQEFIKLLHKYGCKSPEQLLLIENFVIHMKTSQNINIILLKKREMKKANGDERNILMNRLAAEYPIEYLSFLTSYFLTNYPQKQDTTKLIQNLQIKIERLKQQAAYNKIPLPNQINQQNQLDQLIPQIDNNFISHPLNTNDEMLERTGDQPNYPYQFDDLPNYSDQFDQFYQFDDQANNFDEYYQFY